MNLILLYIIVKCSPATPVSDGSKKKGGGAYILPLLATQQLQALKYCHYISLAMSVVAPLHLLK